jgi:type IV pilus assembly protein PilQ
MMKAGPAGIRLAIFFSLTVLVAWAAAADAAELKGLVLKDNLVELDIEGPFSYTIYNPDPYKVMVEFPGVSAGSYTGKKTSAARGITEINVAEGAGATQVEIMLESPSEVIPQYRGSIFALEIASRKDAGETVEAAGSPAAQAGADSAPKAAAPEENTKPEEAKPATKPSGPKASQITGISFEKTDSMVNVVIAGDGEVTANIFSLPERIVIDVPKAALKAPMPREVVAPVKAIRSGVYPDKVRLVVDLKKDISYEAFSKDNSLIIALPAHTEQIPKPVASKEAAPARAEAENASPAKTASAPAGHYKGQRISLDFQNADIGPIFMLLGEVSGYNVVLHPSVSGTITLKLKDVPWDQVLELLLETFSLGKSVEGNIMRVAPLSQFAQWRQERDKLKETEERTEDLTQDVIKLNYATAADIKAAIDSAKLLSPRGSITTDARMNTLIVKDTPTSIAKMRDLVRIMDVSKPQVMIEAQIVEVSSSYAESLGIRWGGSINIDSANGESIDFAVNTPVVDPSPDSSTDGGAAKISLGTANAVSLQLSLDALETVGKSKSLANPRVLTIDNETASIQQGTAIPVQTTTAEGTSTQYVNANLNLSVTPRITPEGYVYLRVMAANDSLSDFVTDQGVAIEKKSVSTQAIVKDGETLILGGIFTNTENITDQGVPLLSRIPGLGWLFKTRTTTGPSPSELLILITPKIVRQNT